MQKYFGLVWCGSFLSPCKYSISQEICTRFLLCCYTLTDFPISIRLTSLALWQSNYCPSASKATLMNMDKYFMWIHYERLHNHNKAKHSKTVCIFLGINCNYAITVKLHHKICHDTYIHIITLCGMAVCLRWKYAVDREIVLKCWKNSHPAYLAYIYT